VKLARRAVSERVWDALAALGIAVCAGFMVAGVLMMWGR
jgi:hypothetical protein